MKNLFDPQDAQEIENRVSSLGPDAQRRWGVMNVAQMLAHCSAWMEMATGQTKIPRSFLGRLFGKIAKKSILSEGPLRKSMPTDKSLVIANERSFDLEQQRLIDWVKRFSTVCTGTATHSFFGEMSSMEWATMGYKHLDHHLTQFGV